MTTPSPRTIVVPIDFSEASRAALRHACTLTSVLGAQIHAIHVCDVPWTRNTAYVAPPPSVVTRLFAAAETRLAEELSLAAAPSGTTATVRVGEPATELLRYVREQPTDLIVLGTHGWHGAGADHARLGRVTRRIVHEAGCPVLTLRTPVAPPSVRWLDEASRHTARDEASAKAGVGASVSR